jgi:hypothetical protein
MKQIDDDTSNKINSNIQYHNRDYNIPDNNSYYHDDADADNAENEAEDAKAHDIYI